MAFPATCLVLLLPLLHQAPGQPSPGAPGQPPPAAPGQEALLWRPAEGAGRLELEGPLGGWSGGEGPAARIRVTVPGDPKPPQDPSRSSWEAWQEERRKREEGILAAVKARLPQEPASHWPLIRLLEWDPEAPQGGDRPVAPPTLVGFLARYATQRRLVEKEVEAAEGARFRELRIWFNGREDRLRVEVNESRDLDLRPMAGENRLEVMDPVTGQREVRTWWSGVPSEPRLRILSANGEALKILEPGGALSQGTPDFRRTFPQAGTYTVLWGSYRALSTHFWSPEDAAPVQVQAEVILDGGTDRERRIHLQRLCLPGEGERPLGTFHVED